MDKQQAEKLAEQLENSAREIRKAFALANGAIDLSKPSAENTDTANTNQAENQKVNLANQDESQTIAAIPAAASLLFGPRTVGQIQAETAAPLLDVSGSYKYDTLEADIDDLAQELENRSTWEIIAIKGDAYDEFEILFAQNKDKSLRRSHEYKVIECETDKLEKRLNSNDVWRPLWIGAGENRDVCIIFEREVNKSVPKKKYKVLNYGMTNYVQIHELPDQLKAAKGWLLEGLYEDPSFALLSQ